MSSPLRIRLTLWYVGAFSMVHEQILGKGEDPGSKLERKAMGLRPSLIQRDAWWVLILKSNWQ